MLTESEYKDFCCRWKTHYMPVLVVTNIITLSNDKTQWDSYSCINKSNDFVVTRKVFCSLFPEYSCRDNNIGNKFS